MPKSKRAQLALTPTEQEQFKELVRRCFKRPRAFFEAVLNVNLRSWQIAACKKISERMLAGEKHIKVHIRTCHGAGKSFFSAGLAIWYPSLRPQARGLTTAPTWSQVESVLWSDIAKLFNGSLLRPLGHGELYNTELHFDDGGWFIRGASSDRPENLEGQHGPYTIRIIDEAKAVDSGVYTSTAGMLNGPETFDLWISTPSLQTGEFFDRDIKDGDDLIRVVVTVDDLISDERIPQEDREGYVAWKARCAAEWGIDSPTYRARCMAEYMDNAEGALFPVSWTERAFGIAFATKGHPVAGMDVAGSLDGDENAVAIADHLDEDRVSINDLKSWNERDTMVSKGRAQAFAGSYAAPLRIDSIGLGKGVLDASAADGFRTEEYRASDKAGDDIQFSNRKAEDAWAFRELLESGKVSLSKVPSALQQKLKKQMAEMRYEIGRNGKIKIVDPTDSPDLVDAVLIASAGRRIGISSMPRIRGL